MLEAPLVRSSPCSSSSFMEERLPFAGMIKPAFPMRVEFFFYRFGKAPQRNAIQADRRLPAAMRRDRKDRARLRKIVRSRKSPSQGCSAKSTELSPWYSTIWRDPSPQIAQQPNEASKADQSRRMPGVIEPLLDASQRHTSPPKSGGCDSDEGGQLFRLKADSISNRLRTPFR